MGKNTCELVGYYGGDITHAQAAWCSTGGETEAKKERIPGLLKMLADNEHGTPFERSLLHFKVCVDVATHIHFLKHRMFSINGESARYREYTDDKYYLPVDWPKDFQATLEQDCLDAYEEYHSDLKTMEQKLGRKRAKESARFHLTYATQVNLDMSCNFRAFVHFQKLRNSEHAQLEIRELAAEMLRLVKVEADGNFTHSLKAWGL